MIDFIYPLLYCGGIQKASCVLSASKKDELSCGWHFTLYIFNSSLVYIVLSNK